MIDCKKVAETKTNSGSVGTSLTAYCELRLLQASDFTQALVVQAPLLTATATASASPTFEPSQCNTFYGRRRAIDFTLFKDFLI